MTSFQLHNLQSITQIYDSYKRYVIREDGLRNSHIDDVGFFFFLNQIL